MGQETEKRGEKKRVRILARHKWVSGATITESIVSDEPHVRRYTATIRGWQKFVIYEGQEWNAEEIADKVREIRDRIDNGDESVFSKAAA